MIGSVVAKLQSIVFGEIFEIFEKFKPKINGNPPNVLILYKVAENPLQKGAQEKSVNFFVEFF